MSFSLEEANNLNALFATGATAGAALTGLSGGATTFSTSAFNYAIDGIAFHNAAVSGGATPTTDIATGQPITLRAANGLGQARAIVWVVDTAGAERVLAGPVAPWAGAGDVVTLQYPAIPEGHIPFAAHTIGVNPNFSGTFTFGSSNWNTANVTVGTVRNLAGALPGTQLATA